MKVLTPPAVQPAPFSTIAAKNPEKLSQYLEYFSPIDKKGRYLSFDDLKYRIPAELDTSLVWSVVKSARDRQKVFLIKLGEPSAPCHFVLTPTIQKAVSETDRNATSASLEWISSKIGERAQIDYLLKDLIEDESISSSQLEGAATTTLVAKEMLKRGRKPRSMDEKMIVGNYKLMNFVWENREKDLTLDLIQEMHKVGVDGINNEAYRPGELKSSDDICVVNSEGDVVHRPPPVKNLKERINKIIEWANKDHSEIGENTYVHPLIKAIVLHFCIGYEHPFRDGNGRVARALFYWFLFKNDFAAFRYIAISLLLKDAPVQYGKSYLYSEQDDMDLTYFIEYQSGVIIRAINKFKESYKKAATEIEAFSRWLWRSNLYNKLSDKQRTVFQVAKSEVAMAFTIRNVEQNLGCSYNTAAAVLNGLVDLNLFEKVKRGREWIYFMRDKNKIVQDWKS